MLFMLSMFCMGPISFWDRGEAPPMWIRGTLVSAASAIAVWTLVTPGPAVVTITPGLPVILA